MSDDFETVTAKRGDRTREIEALRARYRSHRETLMELVADAPTELIAADYRRVIADIDVALARLNEAAGVAVPVAPVVPPPPQHPARRGATEPGMRPLVAPPASSVHDDETIDYVTEGSDSRSRLLLIGLAALLALGAIAGLIWWASDRRGNDTPAIVEQPTATDSATTVVEDAPAASTTRGAANARPLTVTPDSVDYGIVRKGTRTTRQYEIANNSDEPLSPQVARSTCRCLYYEYAPVVPPHAKETLTVTIDGAKAKPGPLLESIRVSAKSNPSIVATFDVTATVR